MIVVAWAAAAPAADWALARAVPSSFSSAAALVRASRAWPLAMAASVEAAR